MTNAPAASRATRLIASLLFAGLPLVALALAAVNLTTAVAAGNAMAEQERLFQGLSGRLDVLDPRSALDTSRIYLSGDTASLAAADLRTRLAAAVARAGGRLVETRSVDGGGEPLDAGVVLLGATFDIGNSGLAQLLYDWESGLPIADVQNLALRRTESENETEDPSLRADIVVRAYRRTAAP